MGKELITKREWYLVGSPVKVFHEGEWSAVSNANKCRKTEDSEVTAAFGHTEVTGESDKTTLPHA